MKNISTGKPDNPGNRLDSTSDFGECVSVVIPSMGRRSVARAVASALRQFGNHIREVIVVVDGDEALGREVEQLLPDECIVIFTGMRTNANVARNLGIRTATGEFVALLDDDDEWRPEKTHLQLSLLSDSRSDLCTSAVRVSGDNANAGQVWPFRMMVEGESFADFLFRRESLRSQAKILQSSSWIGRTSLFVNRPFDEQVRIHQDFDWLIRNGSDVRVVHCPEDLTLYYISDLGSSMSSDARAYDSFEWAKGCRNVISRRAYSDFILSISSVFGMRSGSPVVMIRMLISAMSTRSVSMIAFTVWLYRFVWSVRAASRRTLGHAFRYSGEKFRFLAHSMGTGVRTGRTRQ